MAENSNISWTEATWNPTVGCSIVSPGCTNCYAMKMADRIQVMDRNRAAKQYMAGSSHYHGTTKVVNGNPVWTGTVNLAPDQVLLAPLSRKKPTIYFVDSMSDLFHERVPDEWIDRIFAVMALCPQHTFQVLTKRSARMREYVTELTRDTRNWRQVTDIRMASFMGEVAALAGWTRDDPQCLEGLKNIDPDDGRWPMKNLWLGVSCEDQERADERVPDLLATPAAKRFVSAEPLLGPIDFQFMQSPFGHHNGWPGVYNSLNGSWWPAVGDADEEYRNREEGLPRLDWVISGGESGPGFRPTDIAWHEAIMRQCKDAGVAYHFKQDSAFRPGQRGRASDELWACKAVPR